MAKSQKITNAIKFDKDLTIDQFMLVVDTMDLMVEYFKLKRNRTEIKQERNAFVSHNTCDIGVYGEDDCITMIKAGEKVNLCETCIKRHEWHNMLIDNSHRRSAITTRINNAIKKGII